MQIILIVSFIIITIIATDENQLMISTSDSFAAAVSDRNIMTTTTSTFLKTSLQSSSQHDSIINSSSWNESNSSSSLSQSNSSSNKIKMPQITDSNLTVEIVVDGLNMPTTMAFLGKDDFLILQKNGSLVRVIDGVVSDKTRLDFPVAKGFYQGLLGIAITNQSISTKNNETYVFLYYTEVSTTNNNTNINENSTRDGNSSTHILGNMVYRYEFVDNKLINPKLLLKLPANSIENHGGYITIGPDNNLYIVIGEVVSEFDETAIQTLTQNYVNSTIVDGRAGILRTTLDGNPVLDDKGHGLIGNTFPLNLYYAYGIHNGFGMDFDPITGILWNTEPGHWINDEINIVRPGFNSGYGIVQGLSKYTPAAPIALVNFNGSGIYNEPEFVWTQKVVPTGLKFLTSEKLGTQYHNDIFVGAFLDGRLYHFDLNQNRTHLSLPSKLSSQVLQNWNSTGFEDIVFGTGFGGISSLNTGPDGYLYVISVEQGKVYRIIPINN
ncbi:MAG TPA: PQQ-dependent sugar dehydrogenase [Nitrososphaeraceae archaeon]